MTLETFFAVLTRFERLRRTSSVRTSATDLCVTFLSCCCYGVTGALPPAVVKA